MTKYEYSRAWRVAHPERVSVYNRVHKLKTFGLTRATYDAMLLVQAGRCKICRRPATAFKRALHIDHDHQNGRVRGLLCAACNTKLATVENKEFCAKATLYLRNF